MMAAQGGQLHGQPTLLLIDDSLEDHKILEHKLQDLFHILHAEDGKSGLRVIFEHQPDLIFLDLSMPTMDGFTTCQRIREISDIPIIVVTANSDPDTVVQLLQMGADDYVTKPYDAKVLTARALANLRRASNTPFKAGQNLTYRDSHLLIDVDTRRIFRSNEPVHLSPTQFKLLATLLEAAPRIISYRTLLENVWGFEYINELDRLRVFVYQLRQNLEPDAANPIYILNAPGQGYYFQRHS